MKIQGIALLCAALFLSIAGPVRASAAVEAPRTMAVMNFDNRSTAGEWDWLGKGMADAVITHLSQARELVVLDRDRLAEILKEQKLAQRGAFDPATVAAVGKVAAVQLILCGSYLKEGDRLKLEGHVVVVESGELLRVEWAEGPAADLFKLERQLVEKVLARLDVPLTEEERRSLAYTPTDSIPAFEHYSRSLARFDDGQWYEALQESRQAVRQDARYLPARARMADLYAEVGENEHALLEYRRLPAAQEETVLPEMVYYRFGRLLEACNDDPAAVKVYEGILARHPDYYPDYDPVIEAGDLALQLEGDRWSTLMQQGRTREDQEERDRIGSKRRRQHDEAISFVLQRYPGLLALERMGLILEKSGNGRESALCYSRIVYAIRRVNGGLSGVIWDDLDQRVQDRYAPVFWAAARANTDTAPPPLTPPETVILTQDEQASVAWHSGKTTALASRDREFSEVSFSVEAKDVGREAWVPFSWSEKGEKGERRYGQRCLTRGDLRTSGGPPEWTKLPDGVDRVEVVVPVEPGVRALHVGGSRSMPFRLKTRPWSGAKVIPREAPPRAPLATAMIYPDPWESAEILMDGKPYVSPFASPFANKPPGRSLLASPGNHKIEAVWPDGERASAEVAIAHDTRPLVLLSKGNAVSARTVVAANGNKPCLYTDWKGRLWLLWDTSTRDGSGGRESDLFCSTSADGLVWSSPRRLSVSSVAFDATPMLQQDEEGAYRLMWQSSRDANASSDLWTASSPDGENWSFPRKITLPMSEDQRLSWGQASLHNVDFAGADGGHFLLANESRLLQSSDGMEWAEVTAIQAGKDHPTVYEALYHDRSLGEYALTKWYQEMESVLTLWSRRKGTTAWEKLGKMEDIGAWDAAVCANAQGRVAVAYGHAGHQGIRYPPPLLRVFDPGIGWSRHFMAEPGSADHPSLAALPDGRFIVACAARDGIVTFLFNPPPPEKKP